MLEYNTIIVGAGPAGMAAALYLKRAGVNTLLLDKTSPGGQILKTNLVENYLGFSTISGGDLALKMYNHIKKNDIDFKMEEVTQILNEGKHFTVTTPKNDYMCQNIIIAIGRIPNKLRLAGEDKIKGISYCSICDGNFYKNETVGVVGGGNSALTNALYLADIAKEVYIFVRHEVIGEAELVNRAKNKENITILTNSVISTLKEENGVLTGVILEDNKEVALKGLFVAIGSKPQISFLDDLKLNGDYIIVDENNQTSLKGVYACGDVIKKQVYQISTAVSEGIIAALSIKGGNK